MSNHTEIARLVMLSFPGWRCWFGSMTEAWWSLPPPEHEYKSLIEAPTAQELVVRMRDLHRPSTEIDTSVETGPGRQEIIEGPRGYRPQPNTGSPAGRLPPVTASPEGTPRSPAW
jgi:hypothetical protein